MLRAGISPEYVLDNMQWYEIQSLIQNLWMKDKDEWERTRFQSYITVQCNSTKKLDVNDIMTFPWEQTKTDDTEEDIENIENELKAWEEKLNGSL